jgi:hypothetical protein
LQQNSRNNSLEKSEANRNALNKINAAYLVKLAPGRGGKQPLDQLLASGWCCASAVLWLRRRKRAEGDRTRATEEEARMKEL